MIRVITLLCVACLAAGALLLAVDANAALATVLIVVSIVLSLVLGIHRGYHKAYGVVSDARAFMSGEIQHARIVEVGDPKGLFTPAANVVLELEGENGARHRFERDVPIPFPVAWGYRLGKRFRIPFVGTTNLTELMAFELRREGLDVDASRAQAPAAH